MATSAAEWIHQLQLEAHPEGGHFRETYRSGASVGECCLGDGFRGPRPAATAIYYLLQRGETSALHRIRSDEAWHFHAGGVLAIHELGPDGHHRRLLGLDPPAGSVPQLVVPAGLWFGAEVAEGDFALVSCTVSPGFDFRDFEMADRAALLAEFPAHAEVIRRLT